MTIDFIPVAHLPNVQITPVRDARVAASVGEDAADVDMFLSQAPPRDWELLFSAGQESSQWGGLEPPQPARSLIKFRAPLADVGDWLVRVDQLIAATNAAYVKQLASRSTASASFEARAAEIAGKWAAGDA